MRIAVLGAGFMGSTHAKAFVHVPGVEIASIYALSNRRGEPLAAELGVPFTADLERILADASIDAVDICLPTPNHRPVTEAALAAGKHVLLEKPIALTEIDAAALVDLAAKSGRVFMIAHVLRFWAEYMELHRLATSGEYGRPVSGFAYRRQPFPAWSELFARSDLTGGAVIDQMIHDYDVMNWIFGQPRAVTARGVKNPHSGGWDQVQVLIEYDGASAIVDGGMMMPESYPFSSTLQVLCEHGAMEYDFRAGGRSVEMGGGKNELMLFPNAGDPVLQPMPQKEPYLAEIEYFIECVKQGRPADRATPADARAALQVGLAAVESLETSKTVNVPSQA